MQKGDAPIWSVMIPVYNRTKYLCETIDSVLSQGYGKEELQIEVIDDCSPQNDPEPLVRTKYGKRVSFYRQAQNRDREIPRHASEAL